MVVKKKVGRKTNRIAGAARLYGDEVVTSMSFSLSSGLYNQLKKFSSSEKRSVSFTINKILCDHFGMGVDGKKKRKKK